MRTIWGTAALGCPSSELDASLEDLPVDNRRLATVV